MRNLSMPLTDSSQGGKPIGFTIRTALAEQTTFKAAVEYLQTQVRHSAYHMKVTTGADSLST